MFALLAHAAHRCACLRSELHAARRCETAVEARRKSLRRVAPMGAFRASCRIGGGRIASKLACCVETGRRERAAARGGDAQEVSATLATQARWGRREAREKVGVLSTHSDTLLNPCPAACSTQACSRGTTDLPRHDTFPWDKTCRAYRYLRERTGPPDTHRTRFVPLSLCICPWHNLCR